MSALMRSALSIAVMALFAGTASAAPRAPAQDPPGVTQTFAPPEASRHFAASAAGAQIEWMLHKSADSAHPNGDEQSLLWLMNRARQDPAAEGVFLASVDDSRVQSALGYFHVNIDVLLQEFAAIAAKPPAAFDARLYAAAREHSLYLIANDAQNHNGQFDRVATAGFHAWGMRGNVFSYADSALYGHAGFNVDWGGNDGTGMQTGRGHRLAIMSIDGDYANVGLAAVSETNPSTNVGPLVVTGNFAYAATSYPDHYNRFLVGTVWEDLDGNDRYDPGEGIAGVEVAPSVGSYFAVTSAGGGYAIPLPAAVAAGPVAVSFSGDDVPDYTTLLDVGAVSELVDYAVTEAMRVPEPDAIAAGAIALLALAGLRKKILRNGDPPQR